MREICVKVLFSTICFNVDFIFSDIAARNCLVGADLKVKVGDYGISLQNYKVRYNMVAEAIVGVVRYVVYNTFCTIML